MRFDELIDLERGPAALVKLALYPLMLLVGFSLVLMLLTDFPPVAALGLLCLLIFLSPLAYLIREQRRGRPRREARRGAERTPVLPHGHEEDR